MSIGWVMFWKALVLTVGASFVEAYRRWRKQRGIVLRQNRHGVYVADDWLSRLERWGKSALNVGFYLLLVWWAILAYLLFTR